MRSSARLALFLLVVAAADAGMVAAVRGRAPDDHRARLVTAALGLTDLCLTTEARYTRHPAVSDPVAPFMDHPGALEHFPSGAFLAPPPGREADHGP